MTCLGRIKTNVIKKTGLCGWSAPLDIIYQAKLRNMIQNRSHELWSVWIVFAWNLVTFTVCPSTWFLRSLRNRVLRWPDLWKLTALLKSEPAAKIALAAQSSHLCTKYQGKTRTLWLDLFWISFQSSPSRIFMDFQYGMVYPVPLSFSCVARPASHGSAPASHQNLVQHMWHPYATWWRTNWSKTGIGVVLV